ncbi:hypothetical protein GCM10023194_46160 [Planotetraspora phitsanulokensis]|uniref:DUF732 domain-containing protein n=2 Tax=Planotetraspora phitsanulokensis TaxID=575192 RepID=A0A8J3XHE7_9ACTN|nr:hypothetical protein Pph01_60630 [Planotetraspora phitsanulokensis]
MALVALTALSGCGSDTTAEDAPSGAPSVVVASIASVTGLPPMPDESTQTKYIEALKAIDPEIVGDQDETAIVNHGRDQCVSVRDWPKEQAKLIGLTAKRFKAPGHPDGFGNTKNKQILAAVRKYLCPSY